jgi:hypothetical protein
MFAGTPNQDNPLMPGIVVVEPNLRNGCLGTCLLFALPKQKT